jgi:hypothetical protein
MAAFDTKGPEHMRRHVHNWRERTSRLKTKGPVMTHLGHQPRSTDLYPNPVLSLSKHSFEPVQCFVQRARD